VGDASASAAADIQRHAFPDDAVLSNKKASLGEVVVSNLTLTAERGLRMNRCASADFCVPGDGHMRNEVHALVQDRVVTHEAERSDLDVLA
jgi:hypothetical protein